MTFYTLFARHYDDIFPPGPKVAFVAARLPAPGPLLDLGCATGAVAEGLAERGYDVTGVDLDAGLLAQARERARQQPHLSFLQADMRQLPDFPAPFAGAFCLGNTLVHLLERADRVAALAGVAARVPAGGRLLVQIVNYDRVLREGITRLPTIERAGIRFERRYPEVSETAVRFEATLTVEDTGDRHTSSVPLFPLTRSALVGELEEAGWTPVDAWGDYQGAPWSEDTFGCLVLAER